ncbi:MAG: sulfite exporter TauE/SafE family protein [Pseudomonadota bacterium]
MFEALPYYLAAGALAGLTSGLLGLGGGIIVVPVLYWVFQGQGIAADAVMHYAVGTSLATIIFTSISSIHAHHRRGAVRWDVARWLAPGVALGALLGAVAADQIPSDGLRILFGVFELLVALQMGFLLIPQAQRPLPGPSGLAACGGGIGLFSSLIGIGGGSFTVPLLHWCRVDMRQAVATSAACGLPIAVMGSLGFIIMGWQEAQGTPGSMGYVYLPALFGIVGSSVVFAPLGAALAHRLPLTQLRWVFAGMLFLIAIKMLMG